MSVFSLGKLLHPGTTFYPENAAEAKKTGRVKKINLKTLVLQSFMIYILLVACGGIVFHGYVKRVAQVKSVSHLTIREG